MPDWSASMQQSYEFYMVDPNTWMNSKRLTNVKTGSITRDLEASTLGSATFDVTDSVGECYIRVYLVTIQNGITEKFPLGTYLVQTPSSTFDGKLRNVTLDAYTPLLELSEKQPPIGYRIKKGEDVMRFAYELTEENARAPVVKPVFPSTDLTYDFVADPSDTYLDFISDLITATDVSVCYEVTKVGGLYITNLKKEIKYVSGDRVENAVTTTGDKVFKITSIDDSNGDEITTYYTVVQNLTKYRFDLDDMGRIMFAPDQDVTALTPIWTYNDDNSSILFPELTMDHDLYGIPNVVEVVYSNGKVHLESRIENNDPNSPISTHESCRGREVVYRVTNPDIYITPNQARLDEYAERLLKALSTVEYTISYTHGYCPVRIGDCVRLNYAKAGLTDIKAKVISQTIKCETGCVVSEKAIFTTKLWG